uniref:Uncharacterized protein n=1 Tax=Piliocolobus tephrosceles TaxID=591936 RepID=A0A8C9H9N3_9PRIM
MVSIVQHSLLLQASTDFTSSLDLHSLLSALFTNYYIILHRTIILALKLPLGTDTL